MTSFILASSCDPPAKNIKLNFCFFNMNNLNASYKKSFNSEKIFK